MKSLIGERIIKHLESLREKCSEEEVLEEEGQMAPPATDSSATNNSLPVTPFGKIARRKSLEDKEK